MPKPKDTGMFSSGYDSEFYELNTDKPRAPNSSIVKPNTKAYKMQYGVSGPIQRLDEAEAKHKELLDFIDGKRVPKTASEKRRVEAVDLAGYVVNRPNQAFEEELRRKRMAEARVTATRTSQAKNKSQQRELKGALSNPPRTVGQQLFSKMIRQQPSRKK
jgi:hypothetical protein